jgi:hypothetical protein
MYQAFVKAGFKPSTARTPFKQMRRSLGLRLAFEREQAALHPPMKAKPIQRKYSRRSLIRAADYSAGAEAQKWNTQVHRLHGEGPALTWASQKPKQYCQSCGKGVTETFADPTGNFRVCAQCAGV